jgi:hypothetical protein
MKTLFNYRVCALALGVLTAFSVSAEAARPAGTWRIVGNLTTGNLSLNQFATGAPCKPIAGTMFPGTAAANAVQGVYCPATGRIVFARIQNNGVPHQLYEGSVSQDAPTDRIGGTFIIWNGAGGAVSADGPDYNFSATKP